MKLSFDPTSPHYDASVILTAQIKLNGKLVYDVTFADEEEGYIIRYARDDHFMFIIKDGAIKTERVDGRVKIVLPRRKRS